MTKRVEIKVFISSRNNPCKECGAELLRGDFIQLDQGALCMTCSGLGHLIYLAAGNMALTRRAKKNSTLSAVVLKFSRARKRSERQGLLVVKEARRRG